MMVQGSSNTMDVTSMHSNCYSVLGLTGLDPDATFSEIRNSYQSIPSLKFQMDMLKPESSPQPNAYLRLLTEFLRDPDIKAQWAVGTTTHDGVQLPSYAANR
jgi:hypothetical protein